MINKLANEVHQNAKDKGFHEGEKNIGEMLALIHSEVSEALEADRKGAYTKTHIENLIEMSGIETTHQIILGGLADKNYGHSYHKEEDFKRCFEGAVKDTFEDELADIVIRVFDLAAMKKIDLECHIKAKMRYNSTREHKHGKAY